MSERSVKAEAEFEDGSKFVYDQSNGVIHLTDSDGVEFEIPERFADMLIEVLPKVFN